MPEIDIGNAIDRLLRFLAVEGTTGREAAIGQTIASALQEAGVPKRSIRFDQAHKRIPVPTESGNLIVKLNGRGALKNAPRLLFLTHMDTVPLCAGAQPKRSGRKIVNSAKTALGGDNRTGCGVLTTLAAELARQKPAHPPLTLLFTVREESGLWGARHVDKADLGDVRMGFNYDGRCANHAIVGAVGADRWEAEIFGRASHAGSSPENGISAMLILAEALSQVRRGGWFGKVGKKAGSGTSNVGSISDGGGGAAGGATNVVTDYVHVTGESRSHDARFAKAITAAYRAAFADAARKITNSVGKLGRVRFSASTDYHPFHLKEDRPVVKRAVAAITECGLDPEVRIVNGGLDANWLVRRGIPTVTFGAGQNEVHTVDEWIDLRQYEQACYVALQLATMR